MLEFKKGGRVHLVQSDIHAPGFFEVTVYRKWWEFWKPKSWVEMIYISPSPPIHFDCRCVTRAPEHDIEVF